MRRILMSGAAGALSSPAVAPAIAACIVALLLVAALPGLPAKTTRVWKEFYTLVLREDAVSGETVRRALERTAPAAVWEGSAVVAVSDLEGVVQVPYAQLSDRLDRADPRFDPWLRGMDGWFRLRSGGRSWRVAYIPAGRTSAAVHRLLRRELGPPAPGRWRLAEYDPLEKALVLAAWLAAALLLALARRAARAAQVSPWLAAACAVCWVPFLASGGIPELCVVLAVFPGWLRLAGLRRVLRAGRGREALLAFSATCAAALAALLVVAGFSWFRVAGGVLAAASSVLLLGLRKPASELRRAVRRRRAFPGPGATVRLPARPALGLPLVAAVAALPLVLLVVPQLRAPRVPVPQPLAARGGFDWRSIARLAGTRRDAGSLPDISDFVAHAAWQQTVVFGRPWGLPGDGEKVTVSEFVVSPATGAVVQRLRTVKSFDTAWLASVTRRPATPGVEAVLLAQGGPVPARQGRGRPGLLADLVAAALCAGALAAWYAKETGLAAMAGRAAGSPLIQERVWRLTVRARKKRTR
jgi:hypothetical protein